MKYDIRSKNTTATKAIKKYVEEKLEKISKYFKNPEEVTAYVLIKVKGRQQIIEVTIPTSNFTIRNEECNDDLYAAIDLVVDKIERQIRKNKTKIKKIAKEKSEEFDLSFEEEKDECEERCIVKRKRLDTKPMNEEEAILQMYMLDHDFFLYKDADTSSINLIYKRKDGNLGIIETN